MKLHVLRAASVLCVVLTLSCNASTRVRDAVVTEREQHPCFGTGDESQMRRLQAVIVSDVSRTPATTIWEMAVSGAAPHAAVPGCVAYGGTWPGSDTAGGSPPGLQPGRIYHVFLNLRRENPADPTFGYEAEFCVRTEAATGKVAVHQVLWDDKLRRKRYDGCQAGP